MKTTNTIAYAEDHLAQSRMVSELAIASQGATRFRGIMCFGDADSSDRYCITVPEVDLWNYQDYSEGPIRFVVLRASHRLAEMARYPAYADPDWSSTGGFDILRFDPVLLNDLDASAAATLPEWRFESHTITTPVAGPEAVLHHVVCEFALGVNGSEPLAGVVDMASRIVAEALERTTEPEFSVDDDGSLSIDLRLSNGLRLLAELPINGDLDVGVYDDRDLGHRAKEVKYLPSATAEELINLL